MARFVRKDILLALMALLTFFKGFSKEYTQVNYQRSNGFPGNKVYCLHQDANGYIWAGTENGLVSFNGYEFKTYTTKDGLLSNEVIGIKEDRFGRLWLISFSNQICYLWKGKVHNPSNNRLLRKISFPSIVRDIRFDSTSNIWINDYTGCLMRIDSQERITSINKINNDKLLPIIFLQLRDTGKLTILNGPKIYQYNKDRFELLTLPKGNSELTKEEAMSLMDRVIKAVELGFMSLEKFVKLQTSDNNLYFKRKELPGITLFKIVSPDLIAATINGYTYLIDINTGKRINQFLKGQKVSDCLIAKDGSIWFATIGKGLFHYIPSFIKSIPIQKSGYAPILFIKANKNSVYYIKAPSTWVQLKQHLPNQYKIVDERVINTKYNFSYCHYIGRTNDQHWISCGDLISKSKVLGSSSIQNFVLGHCKVVVEEDERHLLIGSMTGIYRINKDQFIITDTLYDKRVTSLAKINNTIFAGTLNGLKAFSANKGTEDSSSFLKHPELKYPITSIAAEKGAMLWVANNKASVIGVYKSQITAIISDNDGLMCNSVSALKVSDQFLLVGTDNGLYIFNKKAPFNIIRHLSVADGLSSDQITYLEIANGLIWVGTDIGLNYFAVEEIAPLNSKPQFIVTGIQNKEITLEQNDNVIELKSGSLGIGYDVIDHSGIAKPEFSYRLNNGHWIDVASNKLYFPTIPYGDFTVHIQARSPHWVASKIIRLSFYRPYPFYLQGWFIMSIGLFIIFLIGSFVRLFIWKLRIKDQKKLMSQLNLLELEQMALQGQMNPHFIFNSIASIKEHYNSGDTLRANKLLDTFTALIRTTFEMSSQTFTTLAAELRYLNQYLSIEQERFNNSFAFTISRQIQISESSIPVPTMLLQPLVENAIRHGIRHLPNGAGKITITIKQQRDIINIIVADNGVGREYTQQMKEKKYFHSQVTSTTINQKRISILNKIFDHKISVLTEDIRNENDQLAGTIVFITYPLNIHTIEK